ncbi:WhiB family transcriptional regulator [Saccharothrix sp. ST-888]|uniref:WhiB family transcriptional regulator n=1 Tax=Saccharothrix sp. ST-888 TaxID=1427391 RepID=UPI000696C256|nr:WhiB family transcriptional regulator [Saccharothrix sp. ST-888]
MAVRAQVVTPDWSEKHPRGPAKCRGVPPELFFRDEPAALAICNGTSDGYVCPRRLECLRNSMHNREAYGIWGGMRPADRLLMRLKHPGAPERWTWQSEQLAADEDDQGEDPWREAA